MFRELEGHWKLLHCREYPTLPFSALIFILVTLSSHLHIQRRSSHEDKNVTTTTTTITMYIDISKPPPPLPQPALLQLTDGLSLLPPLSRRGHGPGILVLVPDNANASTTTTIENGVPSPAMKWAEEGYAVVEVQESVIATVGAEEVLKKAIEALKACERCDQKERVGLVGMIQYSLMMKI